MRTKPTTLSHEAPWTRQARQRTPEIIDCYLQALITTLHEHTSGSCSGVGPGGVRRSSGVQCCPGGNMIHSQQTVGQGYRSHVLACQFKGRRGVSACSEPLYSTSSSSCPSSPSRKRCSLAINLAVISACQLSPSWSTSFQYRRILAAFMSTHI